MENSNGASRSASEIRLPLTGERNGSGISYGCGWATPLVINPFDYESVGFAYSIQFPKCVIFGCRSLLGGTIERRGLASISGRGQLGVGRLAEGTDELESGDFAVVGDFAWSGI